MATKILFHLGFVCSIAAFLCMFLAFATPYWYKSWTRVHSPFSNIGLWHVCLSGYIVPRDPNMKSYVGCWWIHSSEFHLVANMIQPSWFRGIQALSVFTLFANLIACILLILYLPDMMYKKVFAERRVKMLFISGILLLAAAFLVFLIALVFAEMVNDPTWMPRPWMNYLSWSYGLCVLSGFFSAFAGMFIFIMALIFRDKELGLIGTDTLDARLEKIKEKEILAAERMASGPPPAYGGNYGHEPSMGGPSSVGGPPSMGGGYREDYPMRPYHTEKPLSRSDLPSDTSSYRDDKISMGSYGQRPGVYPEAGQPRVTYVPGQPTAPRQPLNYRRGPPRFDNGAGYNSRTGSDSSATAPGNKVGESVV